MFYFGPGSLRLFSDLLPAGRLGDRIPVGARYSLPVKTDTGNQPASCTKVTILIAGVKRPERGFDHSPYQTFYLLVGFKLILMSHYQCIVLRCLSHNINYAY